MADGAEVSQWKAKAQQGVACGGGSTGNISQNMLITKSYAQMYLSNPKVFKWAGMAAFASEMVGLGIVAGKATDVFIDGQYQLAQAEAFPYSEQYGPAPKLTPLQKRLNATNLDNMLIAGNKAVYRDIFWQHLVYRDKGLDGLLSMLASLPAQGRGLLLDGWRAIDSGAQTSNSDSIWKGNELLLKFEQQFTLQRVYDAYPAVADALSYALISPLPDQLAAFQLDFPGGSVRPFANRWAWITQRLLPHWKRLDAGDLNARMQLLVMGYRSKRLICIL